MDDPILLNDWHPVAASEALTAAPMAATLLGRELVLWRDAAGGVHAWEDRCPHRGARFSIGRVEQGELVCAYHGWRFDAKGACTRVPSQPGQPLPRTTARAYAAREAYGLVWACVGEPRGDIGGRGGVDEDLDREVSADGFVLPRAIDRGVSAAADLGDQLIRTDPLAHAGRSRPRSIE